jgi:hypothetical protein
MNTKFFIGDRVNTAFPIDTDGTIDPDAKYGTVIGSAGPWQVVVHWDDATISDIHVEDVIFE